MILSVETQRTCAGGGHVTLAVTIDGELYGHREFEVDELRGNLSDDEKEMLIRLLVRAHCKGFTKAQTRNALQAGISFTI